MRKSFETVPEGYRCH